MVAHKYNRCRHSEPRLPAGLKAELKGEEDEYIYHLLPLAGSRQGSNKDPDQGGHDRGMTEETDRENEHLVACEATTNSSVRVNGVNGECVNVLNTPLEGSLDDDAFWLNYESLTADNPERSNVNVPLHSGLSSCNVMSGPAYISTPTSSKSDHKRGTVYKISGPSLP